MLKATINFDEPIKGLFIPEEAKTERGNLKVQGNIIIINAKDPVTMRAMFNGVMKSMTVIKKMEGIK